MFASRFRFVFQPRTSALPRYRSRTACKRQVRIRPCLDVLEDRSLPSVFTVTNLQDSGEGSLRQAILDASAAEDNTIALAVTGTIDLASPLPQLGTDLNIQGPGAALLTVQRSTPDDTPDFSVFTVYSATVNISGLTIAHGSDVLGGGIFNDGGIVSVNDCLLMGNSALRGGGITNFGYLSASNCTIADNTAASKGGGIANFGSLTVTYTDISGNSASTGGAIYNFGEATLTIAYSTLAGNAADFGGGIDINGGMVTVSSSTLAGNAATLGGGILNSFSGVLTLSNCTVAKNSATYQGGGVDNDGGILTISNATFSANSAGQGGGLCSQGTVACRDSIFGGNTAGDGPEGYDRMLWIAG
jgi:hypothetical protein